MENAIPPLSGDIHILSLFLTRIHFHNLECDGISFLSPQMDFEMPVTSEIIFGADCCVDCHGVVFCRVGGGGSFGIGMGS